jgi:hypothetical protein
MKHAVLETVTATLAITHALFPVDPVIQLRRSLTIGRRRERRRPSSAYSEASRFLQNSGQLQVFSSCAHYVTSTFIFKVHLLGENADTALRNSADRSGELVARESVVSGISASNSQRCRLAATAGRQFWRQTPYPLSAHAVDLSKDDFRDDGSLR